MEIVIDNSSQDIKAMIAKVLASENIDVIFKNMATAAFDPVNRKLYIPNYKDGLSSAMYDLFIGHEVGHALFTPAVSIGSVCPEKKNFGQFLNVVEDVRIEKMIKSRFPGLVKPFRLGYTHLISKDFFGDFTADPIEDRSFGDRVNIFFKAGQSSNLKFVGDEQKIVDLIDNANTWEKVVAASHVLYDYVQDQKEDPEEEKEEDSHEDEENESNGDTSDGSDADDSGIEEEENDTSDENTGGSDNSSSEEEESDDNNQGEGDDANADDDNDNDNDDVKPSPASMGHTASNDASNVEKYNVPSIETQNVFEKSVQENLHNDPDEEPVNVYFPSVNTDVVCVKWQDVYEDIVYSLSLHPDEDNYVDEGRKSWTTFKNENKKAVSFMAKEFEMNKAASDHKRTSTATTGVLNTTALHKYKFSDEIFKKNTFIADGKNHGLVMIIDWSGSMAECMYDTLCQLQVLAMFCNKVRIPYEVYAFNSHFSSKCNIHRDRKEQRDAVNGVEKVHNPLEKYDADFDHKAFSDNDGDMLMNENMRFINYLSSTMKQSQFDKAMVYIETIKREYGTSSGGRFRRATGLSTLNPLHRLGGTPLNEAFVAGAAVVNEFRTNNNIEIVNTVFLTDGAGSRCRKYHSTGALDKPAWSSAGYIEGSAVYHDRKTKTMWKASGADGIKAQQSDLIVEYFKKHTSGNLINFYLCPKTERSFKNISRSFGYEMSDDEWKVTKKSGFFSITNSNFDKLFMIGTNKLSLENNNALDTIVQGATKSQIKRALTNDSKGSIKSRIFMTEFMKMVTA